MQLDNHTATYAPRKWDEAVQSVSASLKYIITGEDEFRYSFWKKKKRDVDKETAFVDKWPYLWVISPIILIIVQAQRNYSRKRVLL